MATNTRALVIMAVVWLLGTAALPLEAKKKQPQKQGVIAGTVFQKSGFSLPGATLTLTPVVEEGAKLRKKDIRQTTSDRRGEFSFRVPFGSLGYTVSVEAEGWQAAEKTVQSQWDQKITVTFRLKPVAAGEPRK
jgi:Carboxypeptidase regulatory-like domain